MDQYLTKQDFREFTTELWGRFDRNDTLTRAMGERIAIIETVANKNEKRLDDFSSNTKKTAAQWSTGFGAAAAAFIYGLISLFSGGHK